MTGQDWFGPKGKKVKKTEKKNGGLFLSGRTCVSLQPVMCWMAMFRLQVGEADIFVIDGSNLGPGGLSGELQRACRGREKTCNGKKPADSSSGNHPNT